MEQINTKLQDSVNQVDSKVNTKQASPFNKSLLLVIFIPLTLFPIGCTIEIGDPGAAPVVPTGKIPVVSTNEITSVTRSTAICGGTVTDQGSSVIKARGVCWYTAENPIVNDIFNTVDGVGSGAFTSTITGLISNTTYYVRAYATNDSGTSYGSNKTFKTPPLPKIVGDGVTDIENNSYPTVIIGSQEWMTKNLMVTKLNDGSAIQGVKDSIEWRNLATPGYCWLLNDEAKYKAKYGALYNFYVVETKKLCPVGWHVPSLIEWTTLIDYLGGESFADIKLKEKDPDIPVTTVNYYGVSVILTEWDGSNEVGFTAFASGMRSSNGIFNGGQVIEARSSQYWTSSLDDISGMEYKWSILLSAYIAKNTWDGRSGFSVRCVKNQ